MIARSATMKGLVANTNEECKLDSVRHVEDLDDIEAPSQP